MKNQRVFVRDYNGEMLVRYLFKIGTGLIYVTEDMGKGAIGFPKEDVFKYDEHLEKCKDWNKLLSLMTTG